MISTFETGDARVPAITQDLTSSTPIFLKHLGTPTGTQQYRYYDSNNIIYRLADIILLKAETLNELGRTPEALVELNSIRTRAGLPSVASVSQSEVRDFILKERYVELCLEGKRWYDLIRSGVISRELP
ncbi:MAG: RagB/SusD family nutrient uptake outer membrane protein [Bacteroidetes bacterium]|nr:RagB/SusD family nutrient uptake outer membrane protein [Bacteroidota bacterium]